MDALPINVLLKMALVAQTNRARTVLMLLLFVLELTLETRLHFAFVSRLLWLVSLHTLNATEASPVLLANVQLSLQIAVLVPQFLVLEETWTVNPTNTATQTPLVA